MFNINVVKIFELAMDSLASVVNSVGFKVGFEPDRLQLKKNGITYNHVYYPRWLYGTFVYSYPEVVSAVLNQCGLLIIVDAQAVINRAKERYFNIESRKDVFGNKVISCRDVGFTMYCPDEEEPFIGVVNNCYHFMQGITEAWKLSGSITSLLYNGKWILSPSKMPGVYNCMTINNDALDAVVTCGSPLNTMLLPCELTPERVFKLVMQSEYELDKGVGHVHDSLDTFYTDGKEVWFEYGNQEHIEAEMFMRLNPFLAYGMLRICIRDNPRHLSYVPEPHITTEEVDYTTILELRLEVDAVTLCTTAHKDNSVVQIPTDAISSIFPVNYGLRSIPDVMWDTTASEEAWNAVTGEDSDLNLIREACSHIDSSLYNTIGREIASMLSERGAWK